MAPSKTLFEPEECERTVQRILGVTATTPPQWGRMDAARMMVHCRIAMQVAVGEVRLRRGWVGVILGPLAKRILLSDKPFRRNGPTAPEFRVLEAHDFDRARDELVAQVRGFQRGGAASLTPDPHPFFGRLTAKEWQRLQWKHLDHHLRQFGV